MTTFRLGRLTLESRKLVSNKWNPEDDGTLSLQRRDSEYYLLVDEGERSTYLRRFEATRSDPTLKTYLQSVFETLERTLLLPESHEELKDNLTNAMEKIFMEDLKLGFRMQVSGTATNWDRWRLTVIWNREVVPFMPPEDGWLAEPYVDHRIRRRT